MLGFQSEHITEFGIMPAPQDMNKCLQRRGSVNITQQHTYPYVKVSSIQPMNWPMESGLCGQLKESNSHQRVDRSQSLPCSTSTTSKLTATNINTGRYKTELCRPFEETGFCKYGDKCQFAHGEIELKTIIRHPKYKTDLCHKYHTDGFCGYGTRCNFIHNENELQLGRIAANNQNAYAKLQKQEIESQRTAPGPIQRPTSISLDTTRYSESSSSSSSSMSPAFDGSALTPDDSRKPHLSVVLQNAVPNTSAVTDNIAQLAEISSYFGSSDVVSPIDNLFAEISINTNDHHNFVLNNNLRNSYSFKSDPRDSVTHKIGNFTFPPPSPDSISGDSLSSSSSSNNSDYNGGLCPSPDPSNGFPLPVFTQLRLPIHVGY